MNHVADEGDLNSSPPESQPAASDESNRTSGRPTGWMSALRDMAPYLDLGWRLAGTAVFPPILGQALDVWLGTTPWILLTGCVLGFGAALLQLKRVGDDFGR